MGRPEGQIAAWLEKLALGQYAKLFADNDIDVSVLPHLTDQDLKDLGVSLGDRRKIFAAINKGIASVQPLADAEQLLQLTDGPVIEKNRYVVVHDGLTWEVDEFLGDNAGLVLAEIELEAEDQAFSRPSWVAAEVTHESRYFNSSLAAHPYRQWGDPGAR